MFSECSNLSSLPDLSKWEKKNVEDLSFLFYSCKSIKSLPDISKWNTSNVIDMSFMFFGFNSPISFNINLDNFYNKFKDINRFSLNIILDILKKSNNKELKFLDEIGATYFFNNSKPSSLPDNLSNWDTSNVTKMNSIFAFCTTITRLPDISKWNIKKSKRFKFNVLILPFFKRIT